MAISSVVLPAPLGPVTASRAPGSSATGATGGRIRTSLSGSVRSRSRRAAIRERVSCTAAAGSAVVASNADSGNSIRIAAVIGATASADPDRGDDGAEHADADGQRSVRRRRHSGGRRGPVGGAAPVAVPVLGFGDDRVEAAADPQLGRVLEREHHRDVAPGMMLRRNVLPLARAARAASHGAATPAISRQTAEHDGRGGEITAIAATAATESTAATAIGNTARTSTSDSSSTEAPMRATNSPLCSRITAVGGRVGQPCGTAVSRVSARGPQRGVVRGQPLAVARARRARCRARAPPPPRPSGPAPAASARPA